MEHELKTWPAPFQAVLDGTKTYEFRRNDRNFMVGDRLWLREWDNVGEAYTGRSAVCEVSYMTYGAFGVPEGFAVLALKNVASVPAGFVPLSASLKGVEAETADQTAVRGTPVKWVEGSGFHVKTCGSCGNQCMDMDMDPYCGAPEIRADWPIGKNLCRGRPEQCGPEGKLWVLDTRRSAALNGAVGAKEFAKVVAQASLSDDDLDKHD